METANKYFVSVMNNDLLFPLGVPQRLTREDALNLAAWLVALADPSREEFDRVFAAVCES